MAKLVRRAVYTGRLLGGRRLNWSLYQGSVEAGPGWTQLSMLTRIPL